MCCLAQPVKGLILLSLFDCAVFQELSKITMPIVFNEPLSFLQRISEYMEHTYLIHKACSQNDSIERMQVRQNNRTKFIHYMVE